MTGGANQTFRKTFSVSKDILHWYPGHMSKGMVNMQSKLKSVDCVVEVHDARVALSGRNPNFVRKLLGVKPHILILNKVDLIDSSDIKGIEEKVQKDGVENVLFTNCLKYATCPGLKTLVPKAIDLIKKSERYNRSEARDLNMMIIGIPNVGKSSLINALRKKNLSRKNASQVGAVAGITKSVLTKIKVNVNPNMYLIDTPGILPPNISNSEIALKLALCSCYKDTAVSEFVMADFLLYWFNKMGNFCYVDELRLDEPKDDILSVLLKITQDYNFYKKVTDVTNNSIKTMPDFDKAAHLMVTKFRKGIFGLINLDSDLMGVDKMEPNDGNKQYSLRWEKHAFNLATEAGCFFEDESFLDCTLSAEGQCIDAHKIILSASSSYLSSLLKLMPDKHPILIFNDMKFEQLKSLVAFIYNGSVNISENDIHAFLNAAQSLLIKGLYEEEPKDPTKTSEQIKKNRRDVDVYDVRKNNHKLHERVPPLRKSELVQDFTKAARKERMPKGCGPMNNDCEDSLFKLQEISFTKYIQQHLNLKNTNRGGDDKLNELPDDKLKGPENYIVKSWKHNSVDDLNGRQKQSKSNFLKKLKLEKAIFAGVEKISQPEKGRPFTEHEPEGKRDEKETIESGAGEKVKKEEDNEAKYLIEPKKEIIEEEDINCENFDKSLEICSSESDSGFETRPVSNYFHHPAVETGIPVPLLMCKTSLNEPDSIDSNWMPPVNSSVSSNHSLHHIQNENAQDLQCRTCTQDLPCPTCTKKYKSRYALNRHILYECGKARKSFSCDECGKKVTRQDTLQKHKLIHLVQHLKDKESESELLEPTKAKKKC